MCYLRVTVRYDTAWCGSVRYGTDQMRHFMSYVSVLDRSTALFLYLGLVCRARRRPESNHVGGRAGRLLRRVMTMNTSHTTIPVAHVNDGSDPAFS